MKRLRIGFGIICAIFAIAIMAAVCYQWHSQGCGWLSLIAGCIFYLVCSFGIWYTIDQFLADIQHRVDDDIYYRPQDEE